jgi:hypothetical protein
MTAAQRDAIASPATGLVIFNTDTNEINFRGPASWQSIVESTALGSYVAKAGDTMTGILNFSSPSATQIRIGTSNGYNHALNIDGNGVEGIYIRNRSGASQILFGNDAHGDIGRIGQGASGGGHRLTMATNTTPGSGLTFTAEASDGTIIFNSGGVTERMRIAANGNITYSNRLTGAVAANGNALSSITADFATTNFIRSTIGAPAACGTLNFTNTVAGGSYTITILNANATCSTIQWNGSTTNVKLPSGYAGGVSASGLVYTAIDDGATLWVSFVPF